jgi:uridine kinase
MKILTIGIAGGSGSGKTTVGNRIIERVGASRIALLEMDGYYRDLSDRPLTERAQFNFDHPAALDLELFARHVQELRAGHAVEVPQYDFVTHSRRREVKLLAPQPVLLLEGMLLFENARVRELIDIKLYVEAPADIRFIRRLTRDVKERGRSLDSVVGQYLGTVRPMHLAFVEPTKEYADIIIPWQEYNDVAIDVVQSRIESKLRG